jgi:hypothetical protein
MDFVTFLQTWVPLIVGILAIITGVSTIVYKSSKAFVAFVEERVEAVLKEFKPNGGSSLKDQVNRLETGHNKIVDEVDKMKWIVDEVNSDIKEIKKHQEDFKKQVNKSFDTILEFMTKNK